jgi:hypothetical protein
MSDLSNDTKKHTTKSRETIPLSSQKFTLLRSCMHTTYVSQFSWVRFIFIKFVTALMFAAQLEQGEQCVSLVL